MNEDGCEAGERFVAQNLAVMKRISRAELADKGCADPEGHSEDVASDTSITLLTIWKSLDSPKDAMYVFTVNRARSHARVCRREFAQEADERWVPLFGKSGYDPEEVLQQAEFIEWALSLLNKDASTVITMHLFQGLSFAAIAEALNMKVGTATSIYSRALSKLRKAMNDREADNVTPLGKAMPKG